MPISRGHSSSSRCAAAACIVRHTYIALLGISCQVSNRLGCLEILSQTTQPKLSRHHLAFFGAAEHGTASITAECSMRPGNVSRVLTGVPNLKPSLSSSCRLLLASLRTCRGITRWVSGGRPWSSTCLMAVVSWSSCSYGLCSFYFRRALRCS